MVASLLQTPLNGQPDGKTVCTIVEHSLSLCVWFHLRLTRKYTDTSKGAQGADGSTSHSECKHGLVDGARAVTPGYESQSPELKDILRSKPLKDDLGTERGADSTVARLSFLD